jgi:pimeloyl-ACP methyl ester carboxylesterase
MRTRTVDLGAGCLTFDEWPRAGAPVVLFLHGNGVARGVWRPIAEQIAGRSHAVALDYRGHGGSWKPTPPEPYRWTAIAEEIVALIGAERWSPLVICGHSLGGGMAIDIGVRHPAVAAALVLIEPILAYQPLDDESWPRVHAMATRAAGRRAEWASAEEAATYLRGRFPYSAWRPEAFEGFVATALEPHDGSVRLACPPAVESAIYEAGDSFTPFSQLSQLAGPTWIAQSLEGNDGSRREDGDPVSRIAGLRRTLSDGTGHFLACERFDIPVELLHEALNTIERA